MKKKAEPKVQLFQPYSVPTTQQLICQQQLRLREAQIKSNDNIYKLLNNPFNEEIFKKDNEIERLKKEIKELKEDKKKETKYFRRNNEFLFKRNSELEIENNDIKKKIKNCCCSPMSTSMYNTPK
jgi:hypothetical protein